MSDDDLTVPREQFIKQVLALASEGEVYWHTSDEVREQIDWADIFDMSNVEDVRIDEDHVEIWLQLEATESERVARATHWQPAEYKNHDVTVHGTVIMEWPEDQYDLPHPMNESDSGILMTELDQEGGRPTPPDPEPYDI